MASQRPKIDSGMPYVMRGMYHLNCPPPLKSISKARENFQRALEVRRERKGRGGWMSGFDSQLIDDDDDNKFLHSIYYISV